MDNKKTEQAPKKKKNTTIALTILFSIAAMIGTGIIIYINNNKNTHKVTIKSEKNKPENNKMLPLSIHSTPSLQTANSNSLQKIYVSDPLINVDLLSIILPYKWQYQSSFKWDLTNRAKPQDFYIKIWNPQEPERIEIYSGASYIEFNDQQQKKLHPEGSSYLGNTVKKYMLPEEALKKLIIPKLRPLSKIIRIKSIDNPNIRSSTAVAVIETAYMGKTIEESVTAKVEKVVTKEYINWEIPIITIMGASAEKLKKITPYFDTLSFNETWTIVKDKIKEEIAQKKIEEINQAGGITRQIINQRKRTIYDRRYKWDRTIRRFEKDTDPITGNRVRLNFKPQYTWNNDSGQVFQTDNATLDPNTFMNDTTYVRTDR